MAHGAEGDGGFVKIGVKRRGSITAAWSLSDATGHLLNRAMFQPALPPTGSCARGSSVGTFVDPSRSRLTFGEMATKWTASKVGLKASTRAVYAAVMADHVLPRWKDIPLSAIEHEDVQAWIAELVAKGLSGAHVRKIVGVFSGVLDLSVRGKRLPANPATGVERPRATSKRKRYLTAAQVEVMADAAAMLEPGRPKLASNAAFAQYRLVIFVLAYCGLRWSEIAALHIGGVDLDKRRLTVSAAVVEVDGVGLIWGTPKSHEVRWMSIPRFLVDDFRAHIGERPTDDLLFTAPEGGVMRNRNARRAWFNRAATAAGETGLTPHASRASAHCCKSGRLSRSECRGGPEDARACVRGDDA